MTAAKIFSVEIPFSHNCYAKDGNIEEMKGQITAEGLKLQLTNRSSFTLYFKVGKKCELDFFLKCRSPEGDSVVKCDTIFQSCMVAVESDNFSNVNLFKSVPTEPGYFKLNLECLENSTHLSHLVVEGSEDLGHLTFVPNNFSDHFGRRGPSIHLSYKLPPNQIQLEWFHSEICVPEGNDVLGSYFMTNGFEGGYCGLQVNSPTERRVLFSVWSAFETDNPAKIPQSYQVKLVKSGSEDIFVSKFGGEGSGGQSYLKFAWECEKKYQFLSRIQPHPTEEQSAIFTCFFRSDSGDWQLLASFNRPFSTVKSRNGAYSFLENFDPKMGNKCRSAVYSNQWARGSDANWHEITEAEVSVDETAKTGGRADFYATFKPELNGFLLKNCGFFDQSVAVGTVLKRNQTGIPPEINFEQLAELLQ